MRLGTKEDVRQLIKAKSIRTVDRARFPRVPVPIQPGKRPLVRFDLDEIEAIIERQKQEARGLRKTA